MNHKFTLLTHDYPPAKGGVARYLSSLVAVAKGEIEVKVPKGHSSHAPRPEPRVAMDTDDTGQLGRLPPVSSAKRSAACDVKEVRFWSTLWPYWLPLIKRCLEVDDNRTILVSHVFPIGTAAFIANALGGPEYAVIFHGTDLKRVNNRWKRWLLRGICHNAHNLIVNSQATKKLLLNLVPKANPVVLTPGLEPFDLPAKTKSREQFNIAPETKVVLAVSRLVKRKGIDTLIQSIAELEHGTQNMEHGYDNSKFLLVVVGDGNYAEPLRQLAKLSSINVRWVGTADDYTLYSWYAAADIFCLPGREVPDDIEGFGMVFLEAAYAGLPVIAGASGGASEAVVHNQTGLLITPTVDACTKAIAKLINNEELAHRLGQAGRARVIADFNWHDRWNKLWSIEHRTQNLVSENPSSKFQACPPKLQRRRVPSSQLDISIVIPCYNHAGELKSTLESVAKQTINVSQVIVVDDGSSDNPSEIAEQFKELLPLTFIRLKQNSGAPAARNRGAQVAKGNFIIFLDADAVLKPQTLELMHKALLEHPEVSYAYGDFLWGDKLFRAQRFNAQDLRKQNYIHTSALIRKEDFPGFDESLGKFQDWDLWLTMLKSGKVGIYIQEVLFFVTERKNGMSQWLPSFMYKIPWPILGFTPKAITKYRQAEGIIKEKHHL